ncbi:hypothetical protein HPB47_024992 [Ixodes persulcatus]|uniref:Uncharacterized protein n=1 Tax=Ixodes persulcatus TaxID=34615 RepID=A0AC60Q3E4_IXOPE|nr:hypothetical protein HPB47_024992 [Ixodes persulcatus]
MAAPLEPLSAQAGRKRFTIVEDILLLREVLVMNPSGNSSRWDTEAANLNEALGRNFSVRGVRDRCTLLLGLFKRDDRTNLKNNQAEAVQGAPWIAGEESRRGPQNKKKLEIALEKRRLAMEERQIERRLATEERQCTAVCEENLEEMGGNAALANEFELPFSDLTPTEREMVVRTQNSGLALYEGAIDLPPAPRSPPQSDSG